VWVNRVL